MKGGQTSSGSIISWFKNKFCQDLETEDKGAYQVLNEEAAKIPPGSDGLMVLDWWQGNRTPYTDPDLRGMIYGLSLGHTRAHLFRAMMEGVAFGTENVFDSFRKSGFPVEEVYMGGGTTYSDLWMQIHADVSNVKIKVPDNSQAPALGSAILATVAVGAYSKLEDAIKRMVHYEKIVEPDQANHAKYRKIFKQYQKAYQDCGDWMHESRKSFQLEE